MPSVSMGFASRALVAVATTRWNMRAFRRPCMANRMRTGIFFLFGRSKDEGIRTESQGTSVGELKVGKEAPISLSA